MSSPHPTDPLRRVYLRGPDATASGHCAAYGWHAPFDPERAAAEHEALRAELGRIGAEVIVGTTSMPEDPDAIYAFDPLLVAEGGVIALRPGKPGRREEPAVAAAELAASGIPTVGTLTAPATVEGGDLLWLDPTTLLVGRGYRTNDEGIAQLATLLPAVSVHAFDLPHQDGPDRCLHLLSLVSLLDRDLAVAFLPLLPVRLVELLRDRGVRIVEVPAEEYPTMGPNVLALGPRLALALDGNDETRRRMEAASVEVRTYRGDEISRKGDGGPTCLTLPLERGP